MIVTVGMSMFLLVSAAAPASTDPFRADFTRNTLSGWHVADGVWDVSGGQLHQRHRDWDRHIIFRRVRLEAGTIRVRARVDDARLVAAFGLVLRYPGEYGYTVLRVATGAKGRSLPLHRGGRQGVVDLLQPQADVFLGRFDLQVGQTYELKVHIAAKGLTVWIDGRKIGTAHLTDRRGSGYVGLYTESRATFDDFEVTGQWHDDDAVAAVSQGQPARLELQFAEWGPLVLDPDSRYGRAGAVYVYYRNVGEADSTLAHAVLAGHQIGRVVPPWVGYMRQRPAKISPGAVGQLEIRVRELPQAFVQRLQQNPSGSVEMPLSVTVEGGASINTKVDLARRHLPLAINFMGFSEDLRTVYVYLQNNALRSGETASPVTIEHVQVNGSDVTDASRFGSRQVAADVVPIEIPFRKPLVAGQPVCVVVSTQDGQQTGHVLRAFPSRFNIHVYTGRMARKDFLEDLHSHGVTALRLRYDEEKAWRFGFDQMPMIRETPSFLHKTLRFRNNPVVGVWVDEVDKFQSPSELVAAIRSAEAYYHAEGLQMPLLCFNLVNPQHGARHGYLTAPDAVMHSYGYFMSSSTLQSGFGRVASLPRREYRLARRPFWPYLRDGEIVVPRDKKKKRLLRRHRNFQRTLTPQEERYITFGTLIQGAKSIAHWGYWAYSKDSFYFGRIPCIRMGLGGVAGDRVGPYALGDEIASMLKNVWDEIGRINTELLTIGPLVARSDVSYLARVAKVQPPVDPRGKPAAEAAALVCGLDTVVVVVLNHNLTKPSDAGPISDPDPPHYDPVEVEVELTVPPWLEPKHVFAVDHQHITDVTAKRTDDRMVFHLPQLEVSKIFVITSNDAVRGACESRHAQGQQRLEQMRRIRAVPDEAWQDIDFDEHPAPGEWERMPGT